MKKLMIITAGLFLVGMNSCFYDKADLIYPQPTTCDTATVTYSGTVATILNSNCNGCHGGTAGAGAGIKLDTYPAVVIVAFTQALPLQVRTCPEAAELIVTSPNASIDEPVVRKLWLQLYHTGLGSSDPNGMP